MCRIAHEQKTSVAELLGISKGSLQWNLGFIRATHEWEIGVFSAFFDLLYSIGARDGGSDKIVWIPF